MKGKRLRTIAEYLGCTFNEIEIQTSDFVKNFDRFAGILDEPVADIAAFGHYSIPKACSEQNIKVLLTGIGGDELFGGMTGAGILYL